MRYSTEQLSNNTMDTRKNHVIFMFLAVFCTCLHHAGDWQILLSPNFVSRYNFDNMKYDVQRILNHKIINVSYLQPLAASDYITLSKEFDVIIIRHIPVMNLLRRTEARRFITMIDNFYDNEVRIICSAEASPENLFQTSPLSRDHDDNRRALMDDLGINEVYKGLLFTLTIIS